MKALAADRLLTIPEVAEAVGRRRQVVLRQLMSINRALVAAGGAPILVEVPGSGRARRAWRISVASLRKHYPAWFASSDDIPDALREVHDRIDALDKSTRLRANATGARIRELTDVVRRLIH